MQGAKVADLLEQVFFLLYHGKGYDATFIYSMTTGERVWHVKRLKKQLADEEKAHKQAAEKAKSKARSRPPRRK